MSYQNGNDSDEEECFQDKTERKANGLSLEWSELKNMGGDPWSLNWKLFIFAVVETLIGIGLAFLIYKFTGQKDKYDTKIAGLADADLGYVYFVPFCYWFMKSIMTGTMVKYRALAAVDAPDQHVYKVMNQNLPYVLLESEGMVGKFNRAQRVLFNVAEYLPEMLAINLLGGYVFPVPMLILVAIWSLIRIIYMCHYVENPNGRGPGFMLSQHLVAPTMTGLLFWAGLLTFVGPL